MRDASILTPERIVEASQQAVPFGSRCTAIRAGELYTQHVGVQYLTFLQLEPADAPTDVHEVAGERIACK